MKSFTSPKSLFRTAASLLLLGAGLPCVAADAPAKLKLPELKYERFTLPNGLVVLTHEDHRLPLVAVDLWYHVGPLNEREGRTGFAHLFEHMMFEGSEHVGEKAHIKYVQGAGATDVNGTTNFDRTNYFETMPANQLELAMWLESDRMGFLLEGLDRVKLTNQRDVVRNERRQGEGSPYDLAEEAGYHLLFPKGHPYYASVIGSHADIEAARIADIRDFHQHFYTPNNASIAIAGDFKPAELKALLTKYFGAIPAGPKVEPVNVVTPAITEQKRETVTDTVKLTRLDFSFLLPAAYKPSDADAQLLSHILGGAKASRLDQELVYKRQIAQAVECSDDPLTLTSVFSCSITVKPNVKADEIEAAFWEQIAKLQTDGPTQDELDSARTVDLTRKITGLQRLGGFGGIADTLNSYNQIAGDPGYLPKDIARFEAATTASVKGVAAKYLNKNQSVVVTTVPGKKVVDDVPRSPEDTDATVKLVNPYTPDFEKAQDWRKTVPKPGPELAFHLPVPTTFTLKNGLKVYLIEDSNLPVVAATIVSRAGSEANPTDKPGLASFTASMLGEGTELRTSTQLAEAAERLGTRVGVGAGMDSASGGISVLSNHADAALDLLADVVERPAFRTEDIDRIRKQRLIGIQQESDNVGAIAQRVIPHVLYGDQPYGFTGSGTTASVEGISHDELKSFWAGHYGPADSALIFAGDIKEREARELAEKHFGAWTGAATGAVTLPKAPAAPTPAVIIVDKPGSPQSALLAAGLGVPRTSPDLEAIQVLNYTLGASFASRINMNLREVHGYTYGARSGFSLYREGGPFTAGGLVKTDVTAAAAKELDSELRRILTVPPNDAEMKSAKDALVQSIPALFETTAATAGAMSSIFLYDRPLDYYSKLPERYTMVNLGDVVRVSKETIHPDQLVYVIVGDKTKIEQSLKDLNLAPIEYRDALGNVVK
ncbi:zinc protease [Granulicella aggregans]|uniref:Zinc protease n=1 Tax=Granulicella aggregans TaxID=474949 RepID=A0A7W7ZF24_9BACT|nr:pitrilysin family protein [Granulicella aggregans]MBB5058612.1 zinc protease [Granulicella aggregans]